MARVFESVIERKQRADKVVAGSPLLRGEGLGVRLASRSGHLFVGNNFPNRAEVAARGYGGQVV